MAEQYKSLHPLKYYRDYLAHNVRPDGREFDSFRPVLLNVGSIKTADGSAIAKVGNTTVVCGIKAEICKPKPETANQGFLIPNLQLSPISSSKFKPGPPSEQAQVLTQLVADIIENSECIDLKQLCIFPDKVAWCLYADLVCLDFDGSVVDASILALMGALKSVTLPQVSYDPALDQQQINLEDRKPLKLQSTPVSTTYAVFDDKILLADPSVEEENLCTGIVTVVTKGSELCCVHKPGGSPLTGDQLLQCIEKSKIRASSIVDLIKSEEPVLKSPPRRLFVIQL